MVQILLPVKLVDEHPLDAKDGQRAQDHQQIRVGQIADSADALLDVADVPERDAIEADVKQVQVGKGRGDGSPVLLLVDHLVPVEADVGVGHILVEGIGVDGDQIGVDAGGGFSSFKRRSHCVLCVCVCVSIIDCFGCLSGLPVCLFLPACLFCLF